MTLLHVAARLGHCAIATMLVERGADIDSKAGAGEIPLHYAAHEGFLDIVKLLMRSGARVDIRDLNFRGP